jgi:aspartyl-tRNA(Asn)/glutamyl-tRNA(Gln) amidotransferase subunit A
MESRSISPVEVTRAYLERIQQLDGSLASYRLVTDELAEKQARAAEREMMEGRRHGPLHGIPIALKDLFDTAGIPTRANSMVLEGRVPRRDARVVGRLASAGAVLLGKLTMGEFAIGRPSLDDFVPPARNPWNPAHVTGGSSSGSATAVAAGLCAVSLGTDTGGSIRLPAAYTGVVGLKPTYGLISLAGSIPLAWSLDHAGPMARTVADAALLLSVVAERPSAKARVGYPTIGSDPDSALKSLRIGVPTALIESIEIDPQILSSFRAALQVLRELGADVRSVDLPGARDAAVVLMVIVSVEALALHEAFLRTRSETYGDSCRARILEGLAYSAGDYVNAERARRSLTRMVMSVLMDVDVLVTPSVVRTAPTWDESARAPTGQIFLVLHNLTGCPSLSLPCGFDQHGLPIGLLVSGRAFEEHLVLAVGQAFETATPWGDRHPIVPAGRPIPRTVPRSS